MINARLDGEKLPERLTLKGRVAEAALALVGIRHIERTVLQNRLLPPTLDDLAICHDKVRRLYSAAYDWPAPPLPPPERTSSRTMRQYIKGWITQWDLRRLDGGEVLLVAGSIASNYTEDATLAETHPLNDEESWREGTGRIVLPFEDAVTNGEVSLESSRLGVARSAGANSI